MHDKPPIVISLNSKETAFVQKTTKAFKLDDYNEAKSYSIDESNYASLHTEKTARKTPKFYCVKQTVSSKLVNPDVLKARF